MGDSLKMATSGQATITAGNTSVTVDHTFGVDTFEAILTPLDDLGGRTFYPSNKTATQFDINISDMDFADHSFDWILVEGTPSPAAEEDHYCTVAQVKEVLRIQTDIVAHDAEILNCIIGVEEELKTELRAKDMTVPDSASPDSDPMLNKAAYYLSAYEFRDRASNSTADTEKEKRKFYDKGRLAMDKHINENEEYPTMVGVADASG
jgi:hypothetical protein